MKISSNQRDYRKYKLSHREQVIEIGKALLITLSLSYFFYRSFWPVLLLSVIGVAYYKHSVNLKAERSRNELKLQFRECILFVAANMRAGYAVENAFVESRNDMKLLYGENSLMYLELENIRRGLVINVTLEDLLMDLANRSGCDEIVQFAQVFSIAKRGGGNLSEIMQSTVSLISQRIDAVREIQTVLSGRKMEQNIMKAMPFLIVLYIGYSYPGYFDSLYFNMQGIVIMTICMALYLFSYVMGEKILAKIMEEIS